MLIECKNAVEGIGELGANRLHRKGKKGTLKMSRTNWIRPYYCEAQPCQVETDQAVIAERYADLYSDESRLCADHIESVYLPCSVAEVAWAVSDIRERGGKCVVSAGRTGIAGGAVPMEGSSVVGLGKINRLSGFGRDADGYYLRVGPGLTLALLTGILMKKDFSRLEACTEEERIVVARAMADERLQLWFPVNPTETSAHIGGIVATNASGARTYRYGATREWVRALKVVLADGRLLQIRRGEVFADEGLFLLEQPDGTTTEIIVDDVPWPATKATLGYPLQREMDLIDLFIGSEGTLGVIVEIELRLVVRPESMVGVLAIAPDEGTALKLVVAARAEKKVQFDAIEYFDKAAFQLLYEKKLTDGQGGHLPDLPRWDGCGIYFEISGSEQETESGCEILEQILQSVGMSIDDTWAAMEPAEMASQRVFRHAVPEAVNAIIGQRRSSCPGLHKVGTDMAVADEHLEQMFSMYRADLVQAKIDSVVFGHIGNNHVHVNLLPKNMDELQQAIAMYGRWAERIVVMGGAVAAEHGIGRMKKGLLEMQYPEGQIQMMRNVRSAFDPEGVLGAGVLFDRE